MNKVCSTKFIEEIEIERIRNSLRLNRFKLLFKFCWEIYTAQCIFHLKSSLKAEINYQGLNDEGKLAGLETVVTG